MKNKLTKDAFLRAQTAVYDAQHRIAALQFSVRALSEGIAGKEHAEYSAISAALYKKLNDRYRDLFLFAVVSDDKELLQAAKKAAFDYYLKEDMEIMNYLGFSGSYPSNLESEFREELKALNS